jgi:hypothetical protein
MLTQNDKDGAAEVRAILLEAMGKVQKLKAGKAWRFSYALTQYVLPGLATGVDEIERAVALEE